MIEDRSFDYVIMNPPYNKNLHLDFFNKAFGMCREIICIHPSAPAFNRRKVKEQKRVTEFKNIIRTNMTSMELIDGNLYFSAGLFVPLSITHTLNGVPFDAYIDVYGPMINGRNRMKVDELNYFGTMINPLYEKVPVEKNLLNSQNSEGNYFVNIGLIRGHVPVAGDRFNADFFTMVPKDYQVETAPNMKWHHYGFKYKEVAEKFLEYVKSDYARVFLALYKNNQHLDSGTLAAVPYPDLTKSFQRCVSGFQNIWGSYPTTIQKVVVAITQALTMRIRTGRASEFDIVRQKTTHEVFTPEVVTDMLLDRVTNWEGSFMDPACGDGNILYRIAERRIELGHDKETIAHQLFGFDIVESNVVACRERLANLLGYREVFDEHITCKDFLK
ncbi:conserved hypothetical protein [Aeromonas phage 65]|uniref:DNA methylase adenine-specific domain-containing protein n=1 Tax=Aeromonas phage 65 TaxID=2919549 RepID=E5DSD5_9CAUD|nr:hypothetical protein p65301 [Aeromonas phage 65]ADQ53309.1 conserved hypothetical protein [Aeromonas phage 65]